jgi:hypothetical protein
MRLLSVTDFGYAPEKLACEKNDVPFFGAGVLD